MGPVNVFSFIQLSNFRAAKPFSEMACPLTSRPKSVTIQLHQMQCGSSPHQRQHTELSPGQNLLRGCTGFDGGHAAGEAIPMQWVKWQT